MNSEALQTCHTRDEQALADICDSCHDVAMEMYEKLNKLRVNKNLSKLSSFKEAVKHAWPGEGLEELSKRLSTIRGALELNVLVNLRYVC